MDVRELLHDHEQAELGGNLERLDFTYIGEVADAVAAALRKDRPCEVAYQPGDGTFYGLVFTPLGISPTLETAPPRVVERGGQRVVWDSHAMRGLGQDLDYGEGWVLLSWVEHSAHPFRTERGLGLASSYVGEKLGAPPASAIVLALLLRAVAERSPDRRLSVST